MVKKVCLLMADITSVAVDAMVNPAHASLKLGSGLCGIMHKKAGEQMTDACAVIYKQQGLLQEGSAVATVAGKLPAHHVIHAVSPRWFDGQHNEEELLYQTYTAILAQAEKINASVISIPALATGVHRFPREQAALIAMQAILDNVPNQQNLNSILLIKMDRENTQVYSKVFADRSEAAASVGVELVSFLPSFKH